MAASAFPMISECRTAHRKEDHAAVTGLNRADDSTVDVPVAELFCDTLWAITPPLLPYALAAGLTRRGGVRVQFDHEALWIDAIQGGAYDYLCRGLGPRN
jgi:hypothetical protein